MIKYLFDKTKGNYPEAVVIRIILNSILIAEHKLLTFIKVVKRKQLPNVIFFSADGNYEVRYKSNVLIYPNGEVLWVPPAIYQVNYNHHKLLLSILPALLY